MKPLKTGLKKTGASMATEIIMSFVAVMPMQGIVRCGLRRSERRNRPPAPEAMSRSTTTSPGRSASRMAPASASVVTQRTP